MSGSARLRREVLVADLDAVDWGPTTWPSTEADAERDRLVRRAVGECLSDKQREVVEAYFFEGLSEPEIALRLGIAQQVVHKRLHGARRGGRTVGGALKRLAEALAPLAR